MSVTNDILYVSSLIPTDQEKTILRTNPELIGQQVQKYHRLLVRGLSDNKCRIKVLTYNCALSKEEAAIAKGDDENVEYDYILTGRFLSHFAVLFKSFFKTCAYFRKHKDACLICDVLSVSNSLGAVMAARMKGKDAIGILTDLPEDLWGARTLITRMANTTIRKCNKYILLTDQMRDIVGRDKKSIILEGHSDEKMKNVTNDYAKKDSVMICIYAGGLHEKYGIGKLVDAFVMTNIPNSELHIYGDGDYVEKIKTNKDERVKYHGIVDNDTVVADEIKATLLINPRPSNEEFTKYSFPSKNIEYMASGTAVLTTNLPGMPEEYKDYVYVFEDESVKGMSEKLSYVLSKDRKEIHEKGMKAKAFVLENKNATVQAGKIVSELIRNDCLVEKK